MVRCAFTNILDKLGRKTHSPRIVKAHELCKAIQERSDREITLFEDFSIELLGILNGLLQPSATYRSSSAKREKLWSNFHQMCLVGLPEIWERFLSSLAVEYDDDLLQQSVSQELFEMILPSQFSHPTQLQSQVSYAAVELSEDELNALRYACGYVPYSLLRRYEKLSSDKYTKFVECLGQMAVQCEVSDDDILAYTREWMNRVNRGGLFPLNDMTYIFFVSVEKEVRVILPMYMTKTGDGKEAFQTSVIKRIVESEEVQFNWTLISQCINSEEEAIELLENIVTLWVTTRGFAITAMWMEIYRKESKKNTKKTPALRKGLNRSNE